MTGRLLVLPVVLAALAASGCGGGDAVGTGPTGTAEPAAVRAAAAPDGDAAARDRRATTTATTTASTLRGATGVDATGRGGAVPPKPGPAAADGVDRNGRGAGAEAATTVTTPRARPNLKTAADGRDGR